MKKFAIILLMGGVLLSGCNYLDIVGFVDFFYFIRQRRITDICKFFIYIARFNKRAFAEFTAVGEYINLVGRIYYFPLHLREVGKMLKNSVAERYTAREYERF